MSEAKKTEWKENLQKGKLAMSEEKRRERIQRMKKTKTERSGKLVEVITPEGEKLVFPALREASRQTGLHPDVLRRLCREGVPTKQGHTARFL